MAKTILIVDDDPTHRRIMQAVCEKAGYFVMQASDGEKAIAILQSPEGKAVSLMMLDIIMPNLGGVETLEQVKKIRHDMPTIMLTAKGGIDTVIACMKKGASDFFIKPASPERVVVSIHNALNMNVLKSENARLQRKQTNSMDFADIVGSQTSLKPIVEQGKRAAKSSIPVLLNGESGVGKELFARAIEGGSDRKDAPFITVNCGAIPENLVESTLFGHEKGSFTGATGKHTGKFQEANGGTIFLDEVGELPLNVQVKLLRVLQENEVDPVGSNTPVKVDVRIISATNRNLYEEVQKGNFREDLFYRLNVFPIELLPLRARKRDIPDLINHFIAKYNVEEGRSISGIRHEVMEVLCDLDWPGNIRQLENAVFRAVVLCTEDYLCADDFPLLASELEQSGIAYGPPRILDETLGIAALAQASNAMGFLGTAEQQQQGTALRLEIYDREGHLRSLYAIEKDLISLALETYNGQMSEVARRLGIGRSTLYRKIREQGLEVSRAG